MDGRLAAADNHNIVQYIREANGTRKRGTHSARRTNIKLGEIR